MYKLLFSVFLLLIFYSCGNVFEESYDRQPAQQIVDEKEDVYEYDTRRITIANDEDTIGKGYQYYTGRIKNIKSAVTYSMFRNILENGLEEVMINVESDRTDSWSEINTSYYETSENSYDLEIIARDKDSYRGRSRNTTLGAGYKTMRPGANHYTEKLVIYLDPSVVDEMLKNNDGYLIFKGSKSYKLKIDENLKWELASILIAENKL